MAEGLALGKDGRKQRRRERQHHELGADSGDVADRERPAIGGREPEGGVVEHETEATADQIKRAEAPSVCRGDQCGATGK